MASHNVKLNKICCCCCTWPDCAQEGCWGPRQSPWWGRGLAPWPPSCYTRGSHSLPGSPQGMAASARWTGARNRPCWSLSLHWASDVRVFAIWLGGSWTKPERTDLKSCKIILQFVMRMEMDLSMNWAQQTQTTLLESWWNSVAVWNTTIGVCMKFWWCRHFIFKDGWRPPAPFPPKSHSPPGNAAPQSAHIHTNISSSWASHIFQDYPDIFESFDQLNCFFLMNSMIFFIIPNVYKFYLINRFPLFKLWFF